MVSEIVRVYLVGFRLDKVDGNVEFENAEFCYPTRKTAKILRKLNLSIKKGDKIALVGQSGNFQVLFSKRVKYPVSFHFTLNIRAVRVQKNS